MELLEQRHLLAAGVLDPTFGINGIVEDVVVSARDSQDTVTGAVRDSAGRIIVAGTTRNGHGSVAALARYNLDGQLDTSYGQDGKVFLPLSWETVILNDVAQTAQDNLLLTGWGAQTASMVAQIRPDGTLDPLFGEEGVLEAFPDGGQANSIAVAPNGDILVAGDLSSSFHISRFTSIGNRVRAFGDLGTAYSNINLVDAQVNDLLALADGSVVVAVTTDASEMQVDLMVCRYDANGVWDESFGTDGAARIPIVIGHDYYSAAATLRQTSDGKIVVASTRETDPSEGSNRFDYVIAKLNTDGTFDSTFGNAGNVVMAFRGSYGTNLIDLKVESDNSLLVAGFVGKSGSNQYLVAARLNADGSYVTEFADGGVLEERIYFYNYYEQGGLIPLADGSALFAFTKNSDFGLARLDAGGEIDTTFGADGYVTTNLLSTAGETRINSMADLPDGRILVMEFSRGPTAAVPLHTYDHAIRRYWADGTLDESYGDEGRFNVSKQGFSLSGYGFGSQIVSGDDEFLVVLTASQKATIARLDNVGRLDSSFGEDGWLTVDHTEWFNYPSQFVNLGEAGFLLIGETPNDEEYAAVWLDRHGAVDMSFAEQGILRISKESRRGGDGVQICLHDDGAMTALTGNPAGGGYYDVALQHWLANGTLDPQFGEAGQVTTPLTASYGNRQLVCLPDGGFLAAGPVSYPDGQSRIPIRLVGQRQFTVLALEIM
jgi:uncharacterized delta-60 repeat protein